MRLFALICRGRFRCRLTHDKRRASLFGEFFGFFCGTQQGLWRFEQIGVFRVRDGSFHV